MPESEPKSMAGSETRSMPESEPESEPKSMSESETRSMPQSETRSTPKLNLIDH